MENRKLRAEDFRENMRLKGIELGNSEPQTVYLLADDTCPWGVSTTRVVNLVCLASYVPSEPNRHNRSSASSRRVNVCCTPEWNLVRQAG
jgi:hypothetical protein